MTTQPRVTVWNEFRHEGAAGTQPAPRFKRRCPDRDTKTLLAATLLNWQNHMQRGYRVPNRFSCHKGRRLPSILADHMPRTCCISRPLRNIVDYHCIRR